MMSPAEFAETMRRRDPSSGLILPWFTHGALDEILTWDLADKTVLEWGGGYSTAWWASRARRVDTIEHDRAWISEIVASCQGTRVFARDPEDAADYALIPATTMPDIVCIDGLHRLACLRTALALPRPLTIIHDNWEQGPDFIDPEAVALMAPHRGRFYLQPDHTDHDGRPWQTAIWELS